LTCDYTSFGHTVMGATRGEGAKGTKALSPLSQVKVEKKDKKF